MSEHKKTDTKGHSYYWTEEGCMCQVCGKENEDAPKLKIVTRGLPGLAIIGLAVLAVAIAAWISGRWETVTFALPMVGMAGYRDREPNFMRIVGTDVATGSDMEDSVDLSNYGVQIGSMMGMRIWKVEFGCDLADSLHSRPAQGTLETSEISLRTISSGTVAPEFTDDGICSSVHVKNQGANTTSGPASLWVSHYGDVFPKGLLIVSDRLYLYFNNNGGATTKARARVWYTLEKMSESDWREAWEVWRRA